MTQFPSKLKFASALQYSPKRDFDSEVCKRSRDVRYAIKQDGFISKLNVIDLAAKRIAERLEEFPFLKDYLGPDVSLVPGPRSTILKRGALWPSLRICESLISMGFGSEVLQVLTRVKPVREAKTAKPGRRPNPPEHFETVSISEPLIRPKRITIVDDFVTRGASFIGIYPHLVQAFPGSDVKCFALMLTQSYRAIEEIFAPVEGQIEYAASQRMLERYPR